MNSEIQSIIDILQLEPHVEGGFYRRVYTAEQTCQPGMDTKDRPAATAIFYLLGSNEVSRLHHLKLDELWFYHSGAPLHIHLFKESGNYQRIALGPDIKRREIPQFAIPPGTTFGAEVSKPDSYTLVSCVVVPGFEFLDFEWADKELLLRDFPDHRDIIIRLT